MRGTTTSTSTAMMTIRTRKNMSRSFQRPPGELAAVGADPRCLLSTYSGTKKLAIFFHKPGCPGGGELAFPGQPRPIGRSASSRSCCGQVGDDAARAAPGDAVVRKPQLVTLKNRSSFLEAFC